MRFNHDRSFYIPEGATKIADKQSTAVAYFRPERRLLEGA